MAIKQFKPNTPGTRGMTTQDFSEITTKKPLRSLIATKTRGSGRNNQGRITTRHKGGGARKFYRLVNFNLPVGISAKVEQIEYDPNRSARIARIKEDKTGTYHYIIASSSMKPGQKIVTGEDASIENGNRLSLKDIPAGSMVHAIELKIGGGAQLVRSAGNSAQLMGIDNGYAQVKLPSGEVRLINENCQASIGVVGNVQHQNVKIGKAGRNRHRGKRPSVRGVVMNAVDHPHGGGDGGRHGVGGGKDHGSAPKTPWGQKTLGYKTRRRKSTTQYIVRTRHEAKRR
ncbi:MAG TPA: 50S ribosomal protein L2 [Candidatus Sulfotelmatobacter sp.]|nr:50S ribosomal protein L2 [Candidatus Sulfotelmatobacter sp.]